MENSKVPEIWETKEEKELTTKDLKNKFYTHAKNKYLRDSLFIVLNKDKNWPIELSRRVISEWRIKSRTRERIISIQLLDIMIEGAKYIRTVEDARNTNGIENVSYFENQCNINGKLFKINITVKKQKWLDRIFAYYYSATEA
ncbi:MAG: hypothetical protein FWD13_12930 [Treponema sp.]|nr:hypothetical protein [Treponema sp.]